MAGKAFVRGLALFILLNNLMVERSEAGRTVNENVFGFIQSANEALIDYFTSEANAGDTASEEATAQKVESLEDLYQGDIVMDSETYELLKGSKESRAKRNAQRGRKHLWLSRSIPYILPRRMEKIKKNLDIAINELQSKTCLRFVPHSGQKNYIYFNDHNGCSSKIGKMYHQAGMQQVSIADGCNSPGTILHELVHAIGFWHEQARPDRDKYVRINYENIRADIDEI